MNPRTQIIELKPIENLMSSIEEVENRPESERKKNIENNNNSNEQSFSNSSPPKSEADLPISTKPLPKEM